MVEIALADVMEWVDSRLESAMKPIRKEWNSLLKDAQKALKDIRSACEKMRDEGERFLSGKDHRRYGPGKAALRFSKMMFNMLEDVELPSEVSVSSMASFQKDLARIYNAIGREWSGLLAKMDPYMIMAKRKLRSAWRKIGSLVRDINALMARCRPLELRDEVSSAIAKVEKLHSDLRSLEGEMSALSLEEGEVKEQLEALRAALREVENSDVMLRLEEARRSLENLRIEVRTELRHAWKALTKLRAQASSGLLALGADEREALEAYLSDPLTALAREAEGYPLLRSVLSKVGEALERGTLVLKPSKAEKLRSWLKEALSGSLIPLQAKCKKALEEFEAIRRSEEAEEALRKIEALKARISELERKAGMIKARLSSLEARRRSLGRKLEEELETLSSLLGELSGEEVRVVLEG